MNLYLRLIFMLIRARLAGSIPLLSNFTSKHRVWLNDIDLFMHMNNGRYLTVTDLVRIEMLIRAGIWKEIKKRGQSAVIAGETIQFRKSLRPFQRYEIFTRTLGWDEKDFYVEHRFMSGGTVYALALIRTRFLGKDKPSPAEVLRYVGNGDIPDVNMNDVIKEWNSSTSRHWNEISLPDTADRVPGKRAAYSADY